MTRTRNFPFGVKPRKRICAADPTTIFSTIRLAAVVTDIRELSETEFERLERGTE